MNSQNTDTEKDMKTTNMDAENVEQTAAEATADNMSAEGEATTDNVSVEPTLEEQIAAWRDKYLRLQAEFDNFRKRTIKEKMELVERGWRVRGRLSCLFSTIWSALLRHLLRARIS